MQDTAVEAMMNSEVMFFYGLLHMDVPMLADRQELIYISSVRTQDVVWNTCRVRWTTGTDEERASYGNPCCLHDWMMMMMMICSYLRFLGSSFFTVLFFAHSPIEHEHFFTQIGLIQSRHYHIISELTWKK